MPGELFRELILSTSLGGPPKSLVILSVWFGLVIVLEWDRLAQITFIKAYNIEVEYFLADLDFAHVVDIPVMFKHL